jgi:hypothetical protein
MAPSSSQEQQRAGQEQDGDHHLHRPVGQKGQQAAHGHCEGNVERESGGDAGEDKPGPVPAAKDQAGQRGLVRQFSKKEQREDGRGDG